MFAFRDLPIGILTSLGIATTLYSLMSLDIVMLVPFESIDVHAPFSAAFAAKNMALVSRLISAGALAGIITSTMTGMLSQARLLVVLGRSALLPKALAHIRKGNGTPLIATIVTGAAAACLAFVLDINTLAELVSVGTLYVFCTVCAATILRRCHISGEGSPFPVLWRLAAAVMSAAGASMSYTLGAPIVVPLCFLFLWMTATVLLHILPILRYPSKFAIPLFPWLPSLGILSTMHLLCSLGWPAYVRFALWMMMGMVIYALFGARSADSEEDKLTGNNGEKDRLWRKDSGDTDTQHQMSSDFVSAERNAASQSIQMAAKVLTSLQPEGPVSLEDSFNETKLLLHDRRRNYS